MAIYLRESEATATNVFCATATITPRRNQPHVMVMSRTY
ncbi:hypothetical protein ACVWXS_005005 [Lysinibacillus sp. TE18511]